MGASRLRDETSGQAVSAALLAWYDGNARHLPWRVGPAERAAGQRPDPYRVWLSEVMLQQTTVAAVQGHYHRFTARWPDVHALAGAADADVMAAWAGLGYYARARNLLKCARMVSTGLGGSFPDNRDELLKLPGIGPYTAAAIAAIAHDAPETVVDGNVERVVARLFAVTEPLPAAKPELVALAATLTPQRRAGDHAQAMMDLGATICTPRAPACGTCPLRALCRAHAAGIAAQLPHKLRKPVRPVRHGHVYVACRADGAWLLEERPLEGLLGGMLGWPGSDWSEVPPAETAPPVAGTWRCLPGEVRHTFTHFHLRLAVHCAVLPRASMPQRGRFIPASAFDPAHLPTVMRKAHALAWPELAPVRVAKGL